MSSSTPSPSDRDGEGAALGVAEEPAPLADGRGEEEPGAAGEPAPLPHGRGQGESSALAYFITFSCYGASLYRRVPESDDDAELRQYRRGLMRQAPYYLDALRRGLVLEAIQEVCAYRGWMLLAAHVRTNHVHVVVQASGAAPEKVMNDFKAYASRRLNQAGCDAPGRKRWTRHGSTRYLFYADELLAVMRYVVERQGRPMVVFSAPGPVDQAM